MKQPKSTRHQDQSPKLDFKTGLNPDGRKSPKRKMTDDQADAVAGPLTQRKKDEDYDKINISPYSSEEEGAESSGGTFGFIPMNNLNKSSKGVGKDSRPGKITKVVSTDKKTDRIKKSQFRIDGSRLKASQSIGPKNRYKDSTLEERKRKDKYGLQNSMGDAALSAAQDWQNEKNLDAFQNLDVGSKLTKKSKNSKIGSREGSRRGKRQKKIISSVTSRRDKANKSKVGVKRVLHNSRNPIVYNEFKNEEHIHKDIKLREEVNQSKVEASELEPKDLKFDESHLDEAISYQYSLADRSYSFDEKDSSFIEEKDEAGDENLVEIVKQDDLEKLEAYKDRLPLLGLRKSILKLRLMVTTAAYLIVSHILFEYASLVVIVANSVVLALEDPTNPSSSSTGFLATLDNIFLGLYSLEMLLKILAYGFVLNKNSYLRDPWNILDFVVVVSAYLQLLMSSGANLGVLRSFRVLRPLRTISGIEGLRVIVSALMKAVTLLVDTVIILLFFFIIFAIAGTQLWSGVLKKRCVNENTGAIHSDDLL